MLSKTSLYQISIRSCSRTGLKQTWFRVKYWYWPLKTEIHLMYAFHLNTFFHSVSAHEELPKYYCWMNLFSLLPLMFVSVFVQKLVITIRFSWSTASVNNTSTAQSLTYSTSTGWHLLMNNNRNKTLKHKVKTQLHSLISSMTTVLSIATCTTNLLHVSNTASFLKARQHNETVTLLLFFNQTGKTFQDSFLFLVLFIHGENGKERHHCVMPKHKLVLASVKWYTLMPQLSHY